MNTCTHDLYICQNPRKLGWLIYCAICDRTTTTQPTKEQAINAWKNQDLDDYDFDRMELTGESIII